MARKRRKHLSHEQMLAIKFGEGADPRSAWSGMSKRQRKIIRGWSNKRGTTIEGTIRGGPRALQERSASGLSRQATRVISRAYAPARKELNRQEASIKALRDKQSQDEQAFQSWLTSKQAELRGQQTAVEAETNHLIGDAVPAARRDYAAQEQAAEQALGQQAGLVAPANVDLSAGRDRAAALAAGAARRAGDSDKTRAMVSRLVGESNIAGATDRRGAADRQMEHGLSKLGAEREKLRISQSADTAKELARLKDQQVAIAQSQRDYRLAAQKLGVDAADKAADRRLDRAKLGLDRREQRERERANRADEGIAQQNADTARIRAQGQGSGKNGRLDSDDIKTNREAWHEIVSISSDPHGRASVTYRRHPLLVRAARQKLTRGKVTYEMFRKVKRLYGISLAHDPPGYGGVTNLGGR